MPAGADTTDPVSTSAVSGVADVISVVLTAVTNGIVTGPSVASSSVVVGVRTGQVTMGARTSPASTSTGRAASTSCTIAPTVGAPAIGCSAFWRLRKG
ncbi:MAG: hypothetical protein ACREQM_15090 [Candidatus Dormibacteraceae bacterium]